MHSLPVDFCKIKSSFSDFSLQFSGFYSTLCTCGRPFSECSDTYSHYESTFHSTVHDCFVMIYLPSTLLSIIFILLAKFGCLPIFGQISLLFLWKNKKSPGLEISRLTGL